MKKARRAAGLSQFGGNVRKRRADRRWGGCAASLLRTRLQDGFPW